MEVRLRGECVIAELSEQETKVLLKEMTRKKIRYLLSKHQIKDVDVYTVIKEFFKEYLHARYEFTFEELQEECKKVYLEKKVKDELFGIIDLFNTVEYQDEPLPHHLLKEVLERFDTLLDHLILDYKKRTFIHRVFGVKQAPITPPPLTDKPMQTRPSTEEVKGEYHKGKDNTATPPSSSEQEQAVGLSTQTEGQPESFIDQDEPPLSTTPTQHVEEEIADQWVEDAQPEIPVPTEHQKVDEWTQDTPEEDTTEHNNIVLSEELSQSTSSTELEEHNEKKQDSGEKNVDELQSLSQQLEGVLPSHKASDHIDELVGDIQRMIEKKETQQAKNAYKQLLDAYNSLAEKERHQHYETIHRIYSSISTST